MDNAEELLKKGYILYIKNGKIELIEPPEYGEINLKIQDGQVVYITEIKNRKVWLEILEDMQGIQLLCVSSFSILRGKCCG